MWRERAGLAGGSAAQIRRVLLALILERALVFVL
jgi:hypothetical protein